MDDFPGDLWLEKCSLSLRNCQCAWQQDAVAGSAHWWSGPRSDLTLPWSKRGEPPISPCNSVWLQGALCCNRRHWAFPAAPCSQEATAMQVPYSQPHCCSSGKTGTRSAQPSHGLRLTCNVQFSAFPLQAVSLSFLSREEFGYIWAINWRNEQLLSELDQCGPQTLRVVCKTMLKYWWCCCSVPFGIVDVPSLWGQDGLGLE